MALKDMIFEKEIIKTTGGEFSVRGLTTSDLLSLFREYDGEIQTISNGVSDGTFTDAHLVQRLLTEAPLLAAAIITTAADEPEERDAVLKMPFGTQFFVIQKIAELTFKDEGGVENFIRKVKLLLAKNRPTTST